MNAKLLEQAKVTIGPYTGHTAAYALRMVIKHELAHALARKRFFGTTPTKLQVNKNGTAFVKEEDGATLRFIQKAQETKDEEMAYNYAIMSACGYTSEGGEVLSEWLHGIEKGVHTSENCADVSGIKLAFSVLGSLRGFNTLTATTVAQRHKLGNLNMLHIKDDPIISKDELAVISIEFVNETLNRAADWVAQNAKKLDELTNRVIKTWGYTPSLNAANLRALLKDA